MWQPDGWGARARIGILMPHFDIGPEAEFQAMAPDGVTIHSTRVPLGVTMPAGAMDPGIALAPARDFAEPPLIDDAAELLAAAPLHAIVYGFASSSYLLGAFATGYGFISYKMLNGFSSGTRRTLLKPTFMQSSRTFGSWKPSVPRAAPPPARDVVIQ